MSEIALPLDPPRSYQAVAGVYDAVAGCWSRGRIDGAKRWQSEAVSSGRDWLFAGVGTGLEALLAARGGARVTALDLAPAMLAATRRRLAAEGLDAELICGDLFEHECADGYDVVIANFVLNVMGPDTMRRALHRLAELTRPSGTLSIAAWRTSETTPTTVMTGLVLPSNAPTCTVCPTASRSGQSR